MRVAVNQDEDRRRTYAEWYVWAGRNLTSTPEIRHACAQAATEAKLAGDDPATAARAAAQNRSGPGWTSSANPGVRTYAEWYDWGRTTLNLTGEPLHAAAAGAIGAMERGGDAATAADAARHASTEAGLPPPPPAPSAMAAPSEIPPPPAPQPPTPGQGWVPPNQNPTPTDAGPSAAPPSPPPPPSAPPPPPIPAPAPPTWQPSPAPAWQPPPPSGPPPNAPGAPPPIGYPGPVMSTAPVQVPVWVAIVLGIGCGISFLIAVVYAIVLTDPTNTKDIVVASWVLTILGFLSFGSSLAALIGIISKAGWARVMSIIAGAVFCLSCAGIIFGLPVIIGAATARASSRA